MPLYSAHICTEPPSLCRFQGISASTLHFNILLYLPLLPRLSAIHWRTLNPKHIIASNQDLTKRGGHLLVNVLLGVGELDVHVGVDRDEHAPVLGLSPFEADDDFLVDTVNGELEYVSDG